MCCIVVDGRNAGHSIGMTIDELALFARDSLAATWGIAQDGGGSSTMLVNGVVRNIPAVPCQMIFAPIVVGQDDPAIQNPPIQKVVTGPDSLPAVLPMCERRVANGMMMVVLESSNPSLSYVPGAAAITNSPTDVRLGPGTNYAVIATLPANTKGIIQDHALRGVFAKGQYWWKVSYSGVSGWVSEQSLSPEKAAPPTPSNQQ
ncbi:MAG: hypothetical protein EHM70_04520 [Chloroflexota bacterium]|nr:MAG: hypothetical protein EHM70_04520 [Chloroflexota bacterium]